MKRILAFLLALVMILGLVGCGNTSVGIIGGADGPTEILVTTGGEGSEEAGEAQITESEEALSEEADEPAEETAEEVAEEAPVSEEATLIDAEGWYYSAEDVSLYLYTYGYLPGNFITKNEARDLGWEGGSVENYAPGCAIGGDKFGNREGILPTAEGRQYYECDIDTDGQSSRGAKRIVFSNDGLIYYTEDHYETFTLLYGEE